MRSFSIHEGVPSIRCQRFFGVSRSLARAGLAAAVTALGLAFATPPPALAQSTPLPERVPVPTPRPGNLGLPPIEGATDAIRPAPPVAPQAAPASARATPRATTSETNIPSSGKRANATAISGSLKSGLDALSDKNTARALGIRAGLPAGSLERKALAWAIALSGQAGITSGEIAAIAADLPDWPGGKTMRRNAEAALAREGLSAQEIIRAFGRAQPESLEGAILLAGAHLAAGNQRAANAAIAPIWRQERLSKREEKRVLDTVGRALTRDDHRFRMHKLFYRERTEAGLRMAGLAEQASLARARAAVIGNAKDADAKIQAVAPSSARDVAYLYTQIKRARRLGNYRKAAQLMQRAPTDPAVLVDPDEWWIERRLISRGLLDIGQPELAYKIAARHSAESPARKAEAEFHAGWYALRFLNDKRRAQRHFENILKVSARPISLARGHYWLARTLTGARAAEHYRQAARHGGTFYGQLAAQQLGQRKLRITNPDPGAQDRARFAARELVRAIKAFEDADHEWRARALYRALARTLDSAGELELLAVRAERRGDMPLALQVGKIAHGRGLDVDTVSWPIGAIPSKARIGDTGKALAYAIARQESAFNAAAVSPANARGLLQLLPGTAKMMARKTGQRYSYKRLTTDAAYNATLGAAYLSEQLDNFGNSYILTFAGYNAGPGRVKEWLERFGDPRGKPIEEVVDWIERIPFTETRNYVQRVMENYQIYKTRLTGEPLDIEGDLRFGRRGG